MTDSIIADHEEAEPTEKKEEGDLSPLDHLSAEERRKLKGKGKATEASPEENTSGDDLARMTRELAFKNSVSLQFFSSFLGRRIENIIGFLRSSSLPKLRSCPISARQWLVVYA